MLTKLVFFWWESSSLRSSFRLAENIGVFKFEYHGLGRILEPRPPEPAAPGVLDVDAGVLLGLLVWCRCVGAVLLWMSVWCRHTSLMYWRSSVDQLRTS